MRVVVINLRRSRERRAAVGAALNGLGVPFELHPAVDAANGELQQYEPRIRLDRRRGIAVAPGSLGCFASNWLLWQECARGTEPMLILQDDIALDARFPTAVAKAGASVLAGSLMIRLYGNYPWRTVPVADLGDGFTLVRYLKGPKGAQAQMISPEGARRLLRFADVWSEPVDFFMDRYWVHGVPPLAITPFAVDHLPVPSDIGDRPEGHFTLRRRMLKTTDSARRRIANARFRLGELLG